MLGVSIYSGTGGWWDVKTEGVIATPVREEVVWPLHE